MKNRLQLNDFWYLLLGYSVVFTNNIYIFIFLLIIIITKYVYTLKSGIVIIRDFNRQISISQTTKITYKSNFILAFTYAVLIFSLVFIIALIIYRFDFWSKYIFK
jgi:hypothetical protein